jgi:hypothetical protein
MKKKLLIGLLLIAQVSKAVEKSFLQADQETTIINKAYNDYVEHINESNRKYSATDPQYKTPLSKSDWLNYKQSLYRDYVKKYPVTSSYSGQPPFTEIEFIEKVSI